MKTKLALTVLSIIFLSGCAKKAEIPTEQQQSLNQAVSTQTELTLMPDAQKAQQDAGRNPMEATTQNLTTPTSVAADVSLPGESSSMAASPLPDIEQIQQALKNANLYRGKVDGDLGPKTKKAIEDFQEQNNLKADGKVGPKTWAKLQPYLNQTSSDAAASATKE